ncbi:hypothetical protein KUCAC02_028416, partial [Chaenocephalus aceratus]
MKESPMWEMQKDAELEDGEKCIVEELQKAYFVCCCSPGTQDWYISVIFGRRGLNDLSSLCCHASPVHIVDRNGPDSCWPGGQRENYCTK